MALGAVLCWQASCEAAGLGRGTHASVQAPCLALFVAELHNLGESKLLTPASCGAGMLVAAGGPALVAYLIRHNSLTPVHVDAHSLFSEASRAAADPVPPQFLDGAVCREATECNSTTGEVSPCVGALLADQVCKMLVRAGQPLQHSHRVVHGSCLQQGAGEAPQS